jgi:TRAP-type C4-dicarboxylate transport system permease large subunit
MIAVLTLFLVFVVVGTPIAFALGGAAAIGLWLMEGVPMDIVASRTFGAIDSFTYLAIPFFILAGELMETGGISRRLIVFATSLVGHVRGGLGNVVVVAMMLFSGISGSTNADAAAVGAVMIPSMKKRGYSGAQAGAIVAAAAGMGILVPPCLTMVVYGSVTNTSVAALFAAGFLPAFIMAGALMVHLRIDERRSGLHPEPRVSWRTPTEAAVVAVAYATIAGTVLYREITPAFFARALVRSGIATGAVMLMIAGANILAWLMTVEGVPQVLASLIATVGGGRTMFMVLSILVFLVLFALLDGIPGMLMLIPVFVPIARELGIDLLHYGTVMTTVMGIALFTPPLGVGLYIVLGLSGATLPELTRHLWPYLLTMLAVALVIAFVPIVVYAIPAALGLHSLT